MNEERGRRGRWERYKNRERRRHVPVENRKLRTHLNDGKNRKAAVEVKEYKETR